MTVLHQIGLLLCVLTAIEIQGNPYILFANRRDVRLLDAGSPHGNSTVVVNKLEDAAALDYDFNENSIYLTDISEQVIKKAFITNGTRVTYNIITSGLQSPDGLALDWLGHKLYWTDSETNTIEVSNLDGSYRKVLFWTDLDQPRAIALDPLSGFLYWTDWGEVPKIEKAGMDGQKRQVIIQDNIYWPNGLAVDFEYKPNSKANKETRIFWADAKLSFIHSCRDDGSDRKAVIEASSALPHPFALTLLGDKLYWTDWQLSNINSCNKFTGQQRQVVHSKIYSPMDIHVYNKDRQPRAVNPCERNGLVNGNCSHLCLMSPLSPFYKCACPTGVRLLSNGKTCADGATKLLLLARRTDIRRISLDTPDYTDVVLEVNNVKHAIAIDYDPVDKLVYWTDDEVRAIRRCSLDGTGDEVIVGTEVDHPDGIAIDWIARNLYWTDTGTDRIEVARLNGTSRKVLLTEGLDEPRAIVVDPIHGRLYWSDWGDTPKIESAYLDGTGRVVLANTSLGWPNGLAVDIDTEQIYWADAKEDKIERINRDGTGRIVLVKSPLPHVFGFSVLDDYIYWTDWQRRSIERVDKKTGGNRTNILDELPDLMGLKAVNVNLIRGTNPCANNDGNCSHLCLYRPQGAVCACPTGLELISDGKTCIVPDAFILFTQRADIHRLSLETNYNDNVIPLRGIQEASSLSFDINDKRVYWMDTDLKIISRAFMNGSSIQTVVPHGLNFPEALSVDWIARNIYWADTGTRRIEMARLDGTSRRVLIWEDIEPRSLALDPANGYMYWSDWSQSPRIMRSGLDGTGTKVFIKNVHRNLGLTIDYEEKRLYWADLDSKVIEVADLTGANRRQVVRDSLRQPRGLTQYQDFIYWTDWDKKVIERANKTTGLNRTAIKNRIDLVMDLHVFHTSRQFGWNTCAKDNGGCQHLCISHFRESTSNFTHHCDCPTHYTIIRDSKGNKTCSAPESFMLFSQRTSVSRMVVDKIGSPNMVLPLDRIRNAKAIEYDQATRHIYWIEAKAKLIKRAFDNGSNSEVFLNPGHLHQPYDMVVNPYMRHLYWTCSKNNSINVTRLNDGSTVGIIRIGNGKPRSLAIHPEKGYLFWTNMAGSPKIERSALDGRSHIVLISSGLGKPSSLAVDREVDILCWTDLDLQHIECSDLTGANRRGLVHSQVLGPVGLAVFGDYLYWIDKEQEFIERIKKVSGEGRQRIPGRVKSLSDLISVNYVTEDSMLLHACSKENNQCSHICLLDREGRNSECSCPLNMMLTGTGNHVCTLPPTCPPDQFTCNSEEFYCIPDSWQCDGQKDCKKGEDEDNCSKCKPGQIKCESGDCVPEKNRCDGKKQCNDGSDEKGCCLEKEFQCKDYSCIHINSRCDKRKDCPDGSDEDRKMCTGLYTVLSASSTKPPEGSSNQSNSSSNIQYTVGIVVSCLVAVITLIVAVFACRKRRHNQTNHDTSIVYVTKANSLNSGQSTPPLTDSSRIRTSRTTCISEASGNSSMPLCPYDRNQITGQSSSNSSVVNYIPPETLNPPPSPVTDRSVYAGYDGGYTGTYSSSNSPSTVRSYRHYKLRHIPPPPTTPCSTDVCEESEPYPPSASKKKYYKPRDYINEVNYDSDPHPPPPTPRSHYFSAEEPSCPPSPSTERSFFVNPFPPPPSPTPTSEC